MVRNFRIHPGIGVARVGNSEQEFMIAPERAGDFPTEMLANGVEEPVRSVRDRAGALKRCAARFRLFEYTDATSEGRPVEPGSVGIQAIEWTVEVVKHRSDIGAALSCG